MKNVLLVILVFINPTLFAQKNASVSFEKWISLKGAGSPVISPDGKTSVYSVTSTDWVNNAYDNELWMIRDGAAPLQLTRLCIYSGQPVLSMFGIMRRAFL